MNIITEKKVKQGLSIRIYELELLDVLVMYYLFTKVINLFHHDFHYGIYTFGGLLAFKSNKSVQ